MEQNYSNMPHRNFFYNHFIPCKSIVITIINKIFVLVQSRLLVLSFLFIILTPVQSYSN